jgi:hypothetical protein
LCATSNQKILFVFSHTPSAKFNGIVCSAYGDIGNKVKLINSNSVYAQLPPSGLIFSISPLDCIKTSDFAPRSNPISSQDNYDKRSIVKDLFRDENEIRQLVFTLMNARKIPEESRERCNTETVSSWHVYQVKVKTNFKFDLMRRRHFVH